MIVTGIVTFIVGIVFWYYPHLLSVLLMLILVRFLFPDSPSNAWFLTPEERSKVVQRIKENQTGLENKRFKKHQYAFSHRGNTTAR